MYFETELIFRNPLQLQIYARNLIKNIEERLFSMCNKLEMDIFIYNISEC